VCDPERYVVTERTEAPPTADVAAAYERCRRMQRRHDPTFYWATRRLPAEVRPSVHALYGFVRGADEIVDGADAKGSPTERRAALDAWQAELEQGLSAGRSDHPVIGALIDAGQRRALPLELLPTYMDSMRVDCGPVRITTRAQLDRYMNGSAATVGRIMAPLLGAPPALAEDVARLGVAFQLTNFIRDVREDWELDRVYLPGLDEEALRARRPSPSSRAVLEVEVQRARSLFAEGGAVADHLSPAVRPGMRVARRVYERVLTRVERIGFDVVGRRARLAPWEAGAAAVGAMVR
jgi:phytoene synthase